MSKLDELIAEFCPDGVKYMALDTVCDYVDYRGKTPKKTESGVFLVTAKNIRKGYIDYGASQEYVAFEDYETVMRRGCAEIGDVLITTEAPCGNVALVDKENIALAQRVIKYRCHESLDSRFLLHVLLATEFQNKLNKAAMGGTVKGIKGSKLHKLTVPVPPLEVQREIVRVLDSFALLTVELTANLTAELTARKKQYEFYRDELFSAKETIPIVKLADIATEFYRGSGIKRDEVTEDGIPCVRYGEIYTTYNTWFDKCVSHTKIDCVQSPKYFENGDILFAITGESVEDIAKSVAYVGHEKCLAGGDIVVMKHNQNPRYLAYVLATTEARMQKSKGKVKSKVVHSNVPAIKEIQIPLPSLEVQERYANVLDNFESICTDLNIGLPAEIEARQKQYEYYRDLLLTFAETEKIVGGGYNGNVISIIQYVFGYATLPMGNLFDFRNGLSKGKDFFGKGIPFIRYTDVYNNRFLRESDVTALVECTSAEIEKLGVHRGDVLFTRTSETAEDVGWSSVMLDDIGDCVFNGFTIKATPKTNHLLPEYCAFCFATEDFRQYVTSHCAFTTRASLTGKTIAEYQLAFPSIEKQQEIVDVLNKFHILCNDLSIGLPAEIEARQKQYEYYRDKLLSFKELQK